MSFFANIYNYSPVFLQNMMVSMYGRSWYTRRFGGVFESELKECKEREQYTKSQWEQYTDEQLKKVLSIAYAGSAYYKQLWRDAGFNEGDINNIDISTISKLPFLEKSDLRKYGKTTLLSERIREKKYFDSSGTTGTPVSILYSRAMHQKWSALYEARIRHWAGISRYMSRGMIGGRRILPAANAEPPYYRYNSYEKQVYFSAYHISAATAPDYVYAIRKYGLDYMAGYAVSNYLLARHIYTQEITVPQLKAVITSSEKLTSEMREVFMKVYGCKTYDAWSGVEASGLVSECEHGKLHISPDAGIIELLDSNGKPVKKGEIGEVVCTGFINHEQPLIRYRIGDMMKLANDQTCNCGREMPVIEDIVGRIEDVIISKDGREMVRFHGIFIGLSNIVQAQVVQEDLNTIQLNIVADTPLSIQETEILTKRIYSQLGEVNVQIFQLKEIPCDVGGKYKAVISKVKSNL